MSRCLSDEEIGKIVVDGPRKLSQHIDSLAHQHIIHEVCPSCIEKLVTMITLQLVTHDMTKN